MSLPSRFLLSAVIVAVALITPAIARFGARAAAPTAGPAAQRFPPGSLDLYKLGKQGTGLEALDPRTLADASQQPLLSIWPHQDVSIGNEPAIATSPNGARFAVLQTRPHPHRTPTARDMTLQLFDARTGKALSRRHHPAIPFSLISMSADGARLFGTRSDINWNEPCAATTFYILDARTGRVLHRMGAHVTWGWEPFQTDANLQRLYVLNVPDQIDSCTPWKGPSPTVAAYSLTSGKLLASIRLRTVQAGIWTTSRVVDQQKVLAVQNPGFALSPDGSQLAVVDGASDALTLLNTRSLKVEATERLTRPSTFLSGIASALGLAPAAAEAKGEEDGFTLLAQYTPNGRSLLVTGSRTRPDPHRRFSTSTPLPLRLVDIATGRVKAQLTGEKQLYSLWAAPDGSGIYSLVPGGRTRQLCPCTLRRHDPSTLRILASRTFQNDSGLEYYFLQSPQTGRGAR